MHQITAYGGAKGKVPFQQAILQSPGFQPCPGSWQQDQLLQEYLQSLNVSTIQEARQLPYDTLKPFMTAREAPRVPFTALLERGLLAAGAILVDARRRVKALVRADGAIALGDKVGSIHRMGALAQGLEACNGWTFWHIETHKGLVPIDTLRAEVRAEMA